MQAIWALSLIHIYSKQVIDATGVVDVFDVGNKPSCITFYGGRLWIATHNILFRSKMVAYYYDKKDDRLTSLSTYTIPARVQGVTFDASGKVYLSTSYGRNESSYIKCYKSLIALSSRDVYKRQPVYLAQRVSQTGPF